MVWFLSMGLFTCRLWISVNFIANSWTTSKQTHRYKSYYLPVNISNKKTRHIGRLKRPFPYKNHFLLIQFFLFQRPKNYHYFTNSMLISEYDDSLMLRFLLGRAKLVTSNFCVMPIKVWKHCLKSLLYTVLLCARASHFEICL